MGLRCSFTPLDAGYPSFVIAYTLTGQEVQVYVDYSLACENFVNTFLESAYNTVPVDTGYLQHSISAKIEGNGGCLTQCIAEADANYAQYVEYGTWKMAAEPYFEPAIEDGMSVFHVWARRAVEMAYSEAELAAARLDQQNQSSGAGGVAVDIFSLLIQVLIAALMAFLQELFKPLMESGGVYIPEVEII